MFSFKTLSTLATLALAGFASAAPFAPLADVNANAAAAAKVGRALPNVANTVAPIAGKVGKIGRGLVNVDANADANVKVGRALIDADVDADAEVEVLRRHGQQSLLELIDTAIVDVSVSCHALIYLQPSNATVSNVQTLLNDVKVTLSSLLIDVKALVDLDVSIVLGTVTDLNIVGKIVADLLCLVFSALGGVLHIVAVAKDQVIKTLLQEIGCIIAELLHVVFGLVDGLLGVVGGLLGVVLSLIGGILPIVLQLNVNVLVSILAL